MSQERKRRDGTVTVANTIYLSEKTDAKAKKIAAMRNRLFKPKINRWTKSRVIVEAVEANL